ncbi:MAG TPA: metallophosphoesterase [Actinomycetota bacterium]|nr:metallophosphoesterase [Actinomycetota bacterium]
MIKIAASGDIHAGIDSHDELRRSFEGLDKRADIFLLAGDLTRWGEAAEAQVLADELERHALPIIAVLGNHDYHLGEEQAITDALLNAGVTVLDDAETEVMVDGVRVGVAGTKGFGGGFLGACGTEFGEDEMKAFIRHTKSRADALAFGLKRLDTPVKIALLHYSPIEDTLDGERLEIFPFLGSHLLGEAIDSAGASLALHGHAHAGAECGRTPGGVPVRNVAQQVIGSAFAVYELDEEGHLRD